MTFIHGRRVERGSELTVRGKRGRYAFWGSTTNGAGRTVIDLVGPIDSPHKHFAACYLEDVKAVHRTRRAR